MASIEVMKERARIAGRFNLSARRNPEHRALVALAAQRAGGECHVIPAAPAEKVADVFRRSHNVAGESAVIIVTEINGTLYAQIIQAERVRNLGQDSRGVTTVASASGVTQPETAHEDLTIGTFLQYAQMIPNGSVVLEGDLNPALRLPSSTRLAGLAHIRNHSLCGDKLRRGWFLRFEEVRGRKDGRVQKVVSRASF